MVNTILTPPKPRLLSPHHSLVDWDMSAAGWRISTTYKVSLPSSINWPLATTTWYHQLCKNANCLKVSEGSIITQAMDLAGNTFLAFLFRNTAPAGISNIQNCYKLDITLDATSWWLREYQTGVQTRIWTRGKTAQGIMAWQKYRVSWWLIGWNLTVTLEWWNGTAWVQQGDIVTVTDPLFGAETIQRAGLSYYHGSYPWTIYIDDTEIWQRT